MFPTEYGSDPKPGLVSQSRMLPAAGSWLHAACRPAPLSFSRGTLMLRRTAQHAPPPQTPPRTGPTASPQVGVTISILQTRKPRLRGHIRQRWGLESRASRSAESGVSPNGTCSLHHGEELWADGEAPRAAWAGAHLVAHTSSPPRAREECRQGDRWGRSGPTAARTASGGGLRPAFSKTLESTRWEYARPPGDPSTPFTCGVSGRQPLNTPAAPGSRGTLHPSTRGLMNPAFAAQGREEMCPRTSDGLSLSGQRRRGRALQAEGTARAKAWRLGSPHELRGRGPGTAVASGLQRAGCSAGRTDRTP